MARTGDRCARIYGRSEPPTGTRGGQFHVGAHRWPLGYTPAYQSQWRIFFLRPWEDGYEPPYQSRFAAAGTGTGSRAERSLHQLVVQPLGGTTNR